MKKMIEWSKFENLELKYTTLCQKQKKMKNQLERFKKLPQAIINSSTKEGLYLNRIHSGVTGITYLSNTKIRKNHCDTCGKRRKTTAHHIIPKRLHSVNQELSQIRIRVCSECERKIHPENGYEESDILRKQNRQIRRLKKLLNIKAESIFKEFLVFMDRRIQDISISAKGIPERLKETPKSIAPALKKCEGRIKELKFLRGYFKRGVNKTLESNR